jgi:hypothetical protein
VLVHLFYQVDLRKDGHYFATLALQAFNLRPNPPWKDEGLFRNIIPEHFRQFCCVLPPSSIHVDVLDGEGCLIECSFYDALFLPALAEVSPALLVLSELIMDSFGQILLLLEIKWIRIVVVAKRFLLGLQLIRFG